MPKGIVKTEEEINELSPEQQVRRKRDSLRICASDAQKRADNWVERAAADPSDETAKLMVPRSQAKADEALARYRAFAKEHPARARKAPAKSNKIDIDAMVDQLQATPEAKPKRVRKPLTQEQKDERNRKARERRAAKKAAAAA